MESFSAFGNAPFRNARRVGRWTAWGLALRLQCAIAAEDPERIIVELWRAHLLPEPAVALTAVCHRAVGRLQGHPLQSVALTLEGWYLLRAGATAAAEEGFVQVLRSDVGTTLVGQMSQEMARRWLTRIDREKVCEALHGYYRDHVGYPETLAVLVRTRELTGIPLVDRWGRPWSYRREPFRHMKGVDDQSYRLESPSLPGDSDLRTAVGRPYPLGLPLRVRQLVSGPSGRTVFLETTGGRSEKPVLTEGGKYDRATLVYLGNRLLLFGDSDYWYLVPTPGG